MKSQPGNTLLWDIFNNLPVITGITTRLGGYSTGAYNSFNLATHTGDDIIVVEQNRKRLLKDLHISSKTYISGSQVHGDRVIEITRDNINDIFECDAFITRERDVVLNIFVADCVPIVIYDKKQKVCGICHCGWKGTYLKLLSKTITQMEQRYKSSREDLLIGIGVSIGRCCYEVSQELYKEFNPGEDEGEIKDNHYFLDLKNINRNQALKAGVQAENISVMKYCSACRTDLFYSHRKEGEPTGRFSAFISLNP